MESFTNVERRGRLGRRHGLDGKLDSVDDASAAMFGLHASDPASVYLACWARVRGFVVSDLEDALYLRRSLVRMLGMRRTMFVVPPLHAAIMGAACSRTLAPAERRRLIQMVEEQGIAADGEAWVERVGGDVLAALEQRGEATAAELTEDVPELAARLRFGEGRKWGGEVGVSTRILFLLATDGSIVRGRPRGTWLSSQYRWATTQSWLGQPLASLRETDARTELLRRYLAVFGPATLTDLKWWTGWTVRNTKAAIESVGAVEVSLEDGIGFVLADDPDGEVGGEWVALLPSLDPTVMGWKEREWYLGAHADELFDRNGNAGPTVWANGRVVGRWAQRRTGEIV